MILYQHIPKTAGTAFRVYIADNIGPAFAAYYGDEPETHPALRGLDVSDTEGMREQVRANRIGLIQTHNVAPFLAAFPDAPVLCCLRDPRRRAVSNYFHLLRGGGQDAAMGHALRTGELDLMGYLRANTQVYATILSWLEKAGHRVALCFHERMDETVSLLNDRLCWKGQLQKRNLSGTRERQQAFDILTQNADEIAGILAEDIALYQTALQAWDDGPGKADFLDLMANAPPRYAGLDSARLRYRLKQIQLKIRPDTPRNPS